MGKLGMDIIKANRLFRIKSDPIKEKHKNEYIDLIQKYTQLGMASQITSIKSELDLYVAQIKELSILWTEIMLESLSGGKFNTSSVQSDIISRMVRYINQLFNDRGSRINQQLQIAYQGSIVIKSVMNSFNIQKTAIINLCEDMIIEHIFNLKGKNMNLVENEINYVKSTAFSQKDIWKEIEENYDMSKRKFGRLIFFIEDIQLRKIIFRDISHAYFLSVNGFNKPAGILAGSIIEELLKQYLQFNHIQVKANERFNDIINKCKSNNLIIEEIKNVSNALRHFRNYVHIGKEKEMDYTISKPVAKSSVANIFAIAERFK